MSQNKTYGAFLSPIFFSQYSLTGQLSQIERLAFFLEVIEYRANY